MTGRTGRGNRTGLALLGLLLLAAGVYIVLRGFKVLGTGQLATDPVYSRNTAAWIHDQRPWIWLSITVVAIIVFLLAVRWLLVQLRIDRLGQIALDSNDNDGPDAGRASLPTGALTDAIGEEIRSYPGVRAVRAQLTGHPDRPALTLHVTVDPDADLPGLRRAVTGQAIAHARTALDDPLPTTLRLAVATRTGQPQNTIT